MRMEINSEKYQQIISRVKEYVDTDDNTIDDFIDGGEEGWDCGDDRQQEWLDSATSEEISSWVISGLR